MVNLFRALIVIALVSLLAGAVVPFDHPIQISVDLNQPPPVWLVLAGAFLVVVLTAIVASGGLLLFRRWGRWIGAFAGLGGLVVAWLEVGSPIAGSLSPFAITLFMLSAITSLIGLVLSYHPVVAAEFRHER